MNSISIIGRLGRDPQVNAAGTMASFSVGVRRQFKNKQTNEYESDWFNCKAFGKTTELIEKNFFKGSQIAFAGHLQNNNYEKDGKMIYRDEIVVDAITFIGSKNDSREREGHSQVNTRDSNSNQSSSQNDFSASSYGQSVDISDDELPFD